MSESFEPHFHQCKGFRALGASDGPCKTTDHLDEQGYCHIHCDYYRENVTKACQVLAGNNQLTSAALQVVYDRWGDHSEDDHGHPRGICTTRGKSHKGNGAHIGAFAFTLTKSPKDALTEEDLIKAVRKVMSQQSNPVKRYAWYLEYKEGKDHPHIHGLYETVTGGRIENKHWKRAWDIWDPKTLLGRGHRGGYHRPCTHEEGYETYISKDGGLSESYSAPIV